MKKVDVIRMICSMPDDTQVFFNDNGNHVPIDNAEYVKGKLIFGVNKKEEYVDRETAKQSKIKIK